MSILIATCIGSLGFVASICHLLIESSTLAVLGGALGLLLGCKGLSFILAMRGRSELEGVTISGVVLGWTAATTILTSLFFGVGPAFLSTGESTVNALRTEQRRELQRAPAANHLSRTLPLPPTARSSDRKWWLGRERSHSE